MTTSNGWIEDSASCCLSLFYHQNIRLRSLKTNCIHVDCHLSKHIHDVGVDQHRVWDKMNIHKTELISFAIWWPIFIELLTCSTSLIGASSGSDDVIHSEHVTTAHLMGNSRLSCQHLQIESSIQWNPINIIHKQIKLNLNKDWSPWVNSWTGKWDQRARIQCDFLRWREPTNDKMIFDLYI